jgi:type IV pilus assembly protein PilA
MKRRAPKLIARMRGTYMMGPSFFIGFFAAISIPAYNDYTLRSRVTEGLNLASSVKASVTEAFAETGKWPRDLRALKFDQAPRNKSVTFVAVNHGTVVIRFSNAAGSSLANQHLTLRPTLSADGDVSWSCGHGPDQGADPETGPASPHATTVQPKYLPASCRG